MTIKKKLGVAIWTIGTHAQKNVIPALSSYDGLTLIGGYTRDQIVLNSVAITNDCKKYASPDDLLADSSVDIVYLSSPTGIHYDQIYRCIKAKKNVLVEKTALPTLKETLELISLAEANGVGIMEAFMYRFHNQFIKLKKLIDAEKYGKVVKIECEFGFPHLNKDDIRYKKELDGGALFDAGAYTLSAARILLGDSSKVVWSRVLTEDGYDVDTEGNAILENDNNKIAICNWKFGASYINQISVWLDNAHILVDRSFSKPSSFDSKILVYQNGGLLEELHTGCDNHFINMLSLLRNNVIYNAFETEHEELLRQSEILNDINVIY
jgi:NDP-hexose-3-ketoreductase